MTELEAYELALQHMEKTGISHYECKSIGFSCFVSPGVGKKHPDFSKDIGQKVWHFLFALVKPTETEFGGLGHEATVYVDDDGGVCRHFIRPWD